MEKITVGLFNDSFPPTIDGVANVTVNYAKIIEKKYGAAIVATPYYPDVVDDYPFEVLRYPSTYLGDAVGYRAGYPFDPKVLHELERREIDIIHTHCPFISTVLARVLRSATGAPIVFTYHTKFDIDIEKVTASDSLRKASIKFILGNINACDEVWVVSEGAGENLRKLGYKGEYVVMENGTDFDRRRSAPERVDRLRVQYGIADDVPVFLFVGRMMWYKGLRISLEGLKLAREQGEPFRFLMVGDGADRAEMERYVADNELTECCTFVGAVHDRELLRDYFTLADLFLFPSDFDTNGIVVREAAACSCPSVLLRGSAAAEGIKDGETGILIDQDAVDMARVLVAACHDRAALLRIGQNAAARIYLSWDQAVEKAYARYQTVLSRHDRKRQYDHQSLSEALSSAVTRMLDDVGAARDRIEDMFYDTKDWIDHHISQNRDVLDEYRTNAKGFSRFADLIDKKNKKK
jgi:glycosyltransferase involved in cell wall biosynthesis